MYPQSELTRLASHKAVLLRRVAARRAQCIQATARLVQPLEWLDQALSFWRRVAPFARFASVPLGFLFKRSAAPRIRILGSLLRWGPLVLGAVRGLARTRSSSSPG